MLNYRIRRCGDELDFNASKTQYCYNSNLTALNTTFSVGDWVKFKGANNSTTCSGINGDNAAYCGEIIDINYSSSHQATDAMLTRNMTVTDCNDPIHCSN
jgi:hypothetical protein